MRLHICGTVVACTSAASFADGEATWLWDVTTQNGDAIVELGETATVTLRVDMVPDVNFPDGPVLGFGAALFDTLAGANAKKGKIQGWSVLSHLSTAVGDETTTDGHSLYGTLALQSPTFDNFQPLDPIPVLEFEWAPSSYAAYTVEYATATSTNVGDAGFVFVWEGAEFEYETVLWPIEEGAISFQVVPATSTCSILDSLFLARRSRCRTRQSAFAGHGGLS